MWVGSPLLAPGLTATHYFGVILTLLRGSFSDIPPGSVQKIVLAGWVDAKAVLKTRYTTTSHNKMIFYDEAKLY